MEMHYRQAIHVQEDSERSIARDLNEAFISKPKALIIENISDSGFGVNELAFKVGMNASVLYWKMKLLTDIIVNEFVKITRLEEVKRLQAGLIRSVKSPSIVEFYDSIYLIKHFRYVYQ